MIEDSPILDRKRLDSLGEALEELAMRDLRRFIKNDPIEFPHLYQDPRDIEVAGFIASSLAFGRVELFKSVTRRILSLSSGSPYEFVINFDPETDVRFLDGIYYRMCRQRDIACMIYLIGEALRRHGTMGELFWIFYSGKKDIKEGLTGLIDFFRSIDTTPVYGNNLWPRGLLQLFPSPRSSGPCKRLNMYLRWMVRPADGIDFGLWDRIRPSTLVMPVDTHIACLSRNLALTKRKNPSWRMAEEITANLRLIDPDDPVKYDFPLCHLGISDKCPGAKNATTCLDCVLQDFCK